MTLLLIARCGIIYAILKQKRFIIGLVRKALYMPKRPRSHILEKISRNRLFEAFTQVGWVVWDLQPDYGEDLLVRIFVDNTATHYSFFVQAKSTDHIERYLHEDQKHITFPIDADHLEYWNQFWEPVILTVWDATSDITYWEPIQKSLEKHGNSKRKKKSTYIDIPTDNILDEKGIKRIAGYTKLRYARFEREREGAETLIKLLEDELKTEIDYDAQTGMIIIKEPDGGHKFVLFGSTNQLLDIKDWVEDSGRNFNEFVGEAIHNYYIQVLEYLETGRINVRDKNGNIVKMYETLEDWNRDVNEKLEAAEELKWSDT